MPTYGYIRTSRDQEPGHPGSDPHVQRRQLVEAGVDHARIYADVAASGAKDYNSRDQWHVLDQQLAQGDVLVVAAIDRLGTALPRDHVGDLRPAAPQHQAAVPGRQRGPVDEVPGRRPRLARGLHGQRLGQYGGLRSQPGATEHQPQDRAGLDAARAKGVELGRPRRLTDGQLVAIRQDIQEGMPVAAVARKYGVARSTLRSTLGRTE